MKFGFLGVCVAAVIGAAACNNAGGGDNATASTNDQQNQAVTNVASGAGTAQDHSAIMRARHEHYEEMGRAMKGIGDQLKAGSPDVAVIQRHAGTIAGYGPQLLQWFPEGSGPQPGSRTRAKAEIWTDAATFRTAGQAFERTAGDFNRAAQGGDLAAIRAALPALRKSCGDCHERFRAPEHP